MFATDTARGLDVFGRSLWLTHHDHQTQAVNVDAHRDHVRGQYDVESVREGLSQLVQIAGDVRRRFATRQLDDFVDLSARSVAWFKEFQAILDVVVDLHAGT